MQLETYRDEGYYVGKSIFDKEAIKEIRRQVLLPFAPFVGGDPTDADVYRLFNEDFDSYIACTKISHQIASIHSLGLSKEVFGFVRDELGLEFPIINTRPVILFSSRLLAKHHFYWKANAHQDHAIMLGSPESIVVWVPLCEMSSELGYLEVIPKSHKRGLLPHAKNGPSLEITDTLSDDSFVSVPMEIGDALFFSSVLVHRSGSNVSDKIRLTVSYRFDNLLNSDFIKQKYPIGFDYVMRGQRT